MKSRRKQVWVIGRGRQAQSLAEYAIILSLVAMVAVVLLRSIGVSTNNSLNPVNNTLAQ